MAFCIIGTILIRVPQTRSCADLGGGFRYRGDMGLPGGNLFSHVCGEKGADAEGSQGTLEREKGSAEVLTSLPGRK